MEVVIRRAVVADAPEILALQKLAYYDEAVLYNAFEMPPLTETVEEIEAEFVDHIFLKAVAGDKLVGSVRGTDDRGRYLLCRPPCGPPGAPGPSHRYRPDDRDRQVFPRSEKVRPLHRLQEHAQHTYLREAGLSGSGPARARSRRVPPLHGQGSQATCARTGIAGLGRTFARGPRQKPLCQAFSIQVSDQAEVTLGEHP